MGSFNTITNDDIKETTSVLNQLVDFVEEDISGSDTRKKFEVFITSSATYGITSSLFHTVYDQNYRYQTANELFDITMGLRAGSATVTGSEIPEISPDRSGKLLFPSQSLMMREKVNIYRQFAQLLLGDANASFTSPFTPVSTADETEYTIDEALFLSFKRLFVRDGIKRESFALKLFQSSSFGEVSTGDPLGVITGDQNITISELHPASGSIILTDIGSSTSIERSQTGGDVGNLVNAANTSENMGLIFYQQGIAVLDMKKVFNPNQFMTGSIFSVGEFSTTPISASFIPDFVVSASIDDVLDHVCSTRFGSGSYTTLTFQNNTKINSTLIFCRATADEFNFSSNPTYYDTDNNNKIVVIQDGSEGVQKSFSFVTTIGLYDAGEELLAVAKLSRPVEKNDEKDLTFRVRLDF